MHDGTLVFVKLKAYLFKKTLSYILSTCC